MDKIVCKYTVVHEYDKVPAEFVIRIQYPDRTLEVPACEQCMNFYEEMNA